MEAKRRVLAPYKRIGVTVKRVRMRHYKEDLHKVDIDKEEERKTLRFRIEECRQLQENRGMKDIQKILLDVVFAQQQRARMAVNAQAAAEKALEMERRRECLDEAREMEELLGTAVEAKEAEWAV